METAAWPVRVDMVIRGRCGVPPVHSRPGCWLARWVGLGSTSPPYAPRPDAPSRVLPGSSLKQHCPPEPCAQVPGPSMCSQNAEARFADACGSNGSKTARLVTERARQRADPLDDVLRDLYGRPHARHLARCWRTTVVPMPHRRPTGGTRLGLRLRWSCSTRVVR